MRRRHKHRRHWFWWAALSGLFVEWVCWATRTDLTHWVEMRERPSLAWEPENDWERGRG